MINKTSYWKLLKSNPREACNKCKICYRYYRLIVKQLWVLYKENIIKTIALFVLFIIASSVLSNSYSLLIGNHHFLIRFLNIAFLYILFIVPLIDLTMGIMNTYTQLKSNPNGVRDIFISFMRYNIFIFALALLYLSFYRFWESWIGNHIIAPFLSTFESNLLNDIIFIIVFFVCLIFAALNWKKRIKWQTIFISISAIIIWVYYRFNPGPFGLGDSTYFMRLKPLSLCHGFKYFDIVPIFALSKLAPTVPLFFNNRKEIFFKDGFKTEVSINRIEEDSLGRKSFVETAITTLLHTNTSNCSFTFGIDAPWGAGKSSVMRMMREQIIKQCKAEVKAGNKEFKNPIIIDFNPWLYAAKKDLTTVFFDELSLQLKRYDEYLAQNIIDYSKLVSAFDTPETKLISSLIDVMKHEDNSLQLKKQLISRAIKRIRKRIIIFIDDLDRLDANEILEMMKLIRNTSDFPYMYFIAAYDRKYLIKCLKDKMPTKELGFTEKIFQVEYRLPDTSKTEIAIKSMRLLKENFNEIGSKELRFLSDDNHLNAEFLQMFLNLSNLRDVKRLVNNFKISKKLSNNAVNTRVLLLMELFRIKYPSTYSYYANYRTQMVAQEKEFNLHTITHMIKVNKEELDLNDTDYKNIEKILTAIYYGDQISNEIVPLNADKIEDIENCFLPIETNVSLSDFEALMTNEDVNDILYEIKLWLKANKTNSLISRIKNYMAKNIKEHQVLIEVLVYLTRTVLFDNNYFLITENLNTYFDKYTNNSNRQKHYTIIKNIFIKHGNSNTCRYLHDLYHKKDSSSPITAEEINEIRKEIFLSFVNLYSPDISELNKCFIFCQLQKHNEGNRFIPGVQEEMREFAKNNFINYIPYILEKVSLSDSGKVYIYISSIVTDIWGDWDSFREFLSNLEDPYQSFDEFKSFYDKFEENEYRPTEFAFKYIKLR